MMIGDLFLVRTMIVLSSIRKEPQQTTEVVPRFGSEVGDIACGPVLAG